MVMMMWDTSVSIKAGQEEEIALADETHLQK